MISSHHLRICNSRGLRLFQDDLEINPVPVLFGGLLKHWGQLGPAEIAPKRKFVYRFFKWQADQNNIPFKMPPRHPYNPLAALRLCIAAGGQLDHIRSVFHVIYGEGTQPDDPEVGLWLLLRL